LKAFKLQITLNNKKDKNDKKDINNDKKERFNNIDINDLTPFNTEKD